jgi:hypothetical protein
VGITETPSRRSLAFRRIVASICARRWLAIAWFCLFAVDADAQSVPADTGSIKGRVVEARTTAPLAAVLVQVEATRQRAVSDAEGHFVITDVPAGSQTLLVSVIGYGLVRRPVMVIAGEETELTIPVAEGASTYVEEVSVTAGPFRESQPGVASQTVLGSRELLALRGLIADDPFRAVQVLPGVAASDDYRAEFAVRGLGPYHVGLAIDDVDSRLLVHTVRAVEDTGSLALINSDILEDATLYSGTYAQTLGSHLGARLDFRTRDGARDRLHVRALVSGSATTTVWEGPLSGGDRGSWLLAARKSYIDWILRRIDTSIGGNFGFTDAQGKITFNPTPAQNLRVSFIAGRSELDEEEDAGLNDLDRGRDRTLIGNLQWRYAPTANLAVSQQVYVVDSAYLNQVTDGRVREEGGDRDITWRGRIEWAPKSRHFLQAGAQAQTLDADRIERRFPSPTTEVTTMDAHVGTSSYAGWLLYRWTPASRFVLSPGVRAERWNLVDQHTVSPWLQAEWQLTPATRLRGGIGVQRQAPGLDESLFAPPDGTLHAERARIVDVGLERRLGETWRILATGFHRDESDRLRVVNNEFRLVNGRIVGPTTTPYVDNVLDGDARGIELTLERRAVSGLTGWLSYAWGEARNTDVTTGESYWSDFDQRHTLNASVAFRWSERSAVSARYRFGSNFPLQGYFEPSGDFHALTSERNVGRLPVYSRLDVRADRAFTYRRSRLTLFVEVVNVLNRENVRKDSASLNPRTGMVFGLTEKLFPFLPSAGVLIEF